MFFKLHTLARACIWRTEINWLKNWTQFSTLLHSHFICSLSLKALNIYESSTERELHQLSFSTLSCSFIMYYYFSQQHQRANKQEEDGENGEGVDDKKEKFQKCTENSPRFFDFCPRVGVENSKLSRSPLYRFRFSYNFSLLAFIHRFNLDFKGMFFQWNFFIAFSPSSSFLIILTTSFLSTTSVSYWKWQKVSRCCSYLLSHFT